MTVVEALRFWTSSVERVLFVVATICYTQLMIVGTCVAFENTVAAVRED